MTAPEGLTAQDWQDYLDTKFPSGVQINTVLPDGSLSSQVYNVPYFVVMEMQGEWPVLLGFHYGTEYSVSVPLVSWTEMDRKGHFVARAGTVVSGETLEFSSWLSDVLAERMAAARPEHEAALREMSPAWSRGEIRAASEEAEVSDEASEESAPPEDAVPAEDVR